MTESPAPPSPEPLRMDTPAAKRLALRWGLDTAMAQRARSITCVSARFEDWPLDDPTLLPGLSQWLRLPQRRLLLLATDYGDMGQRYPRFAQWRRSWVHAVPAWRCPEEGAAGLPEALFDDGAVSVQLFDAETGLGRASLLPRDRLVLAQQTDVVLQRSEAAWPARTLGL